MTGPLWLDVSGLPVAAAADAVEAALREGLDPETDPPRTGLPVPGGEILLMPAVGAGYAGVKVVTIAPDNPARGLPRIQGVYVLCAGATLAPLALLDGAELTALRTPAVSAVALRRLTPDRPLRTVLFGTGPQAWGHVRALAETRPPGPLAVVGRDPSRTAAFLARCAQAGIPAEPGQPGAVRDADLVLCCTTAVTPVFDGALPPATACVVAVGSHQPHVREVGAAYVDRAACYVEARAAATREAGELAGVAPERLTNLAELATAQVDLDRPRFFKSVGMAWEDLVVAAAAYRAAAG
ncbi:MAG TPA: ornithine cyclodeaminase family protein [Micromonosporaceae bacterium]|nr:ornithine cyclodeaminase family protein [Micromonosporaceae bacterium]